MSEMRSLEEALTATYDNLDRLSPRDVSAFWAVVPKFLGGRGPRTNKQQQQQMLHQFDKISTTSMQDINRYGYRDMSTLAISLAKIIDKISKRKRPTKGSPHQILQDILIGNESKIKQYIFREIASASVPILHEFKARELSNLIYAYGLVQEVVLVEGGSTFFDMLAKEVISFDGLDEFWPQALSNIVWAYATAEVPHPKLFMKVANHIVQLDNLDNFKPQHLSNIVWAYKTAEVPHPELLKKVADHIVQLDNLDKFIPQNLSNTVWAYATLNEEHPKLFEKIANHIVSLNNLDKFNSQNLKDIVWAYATAGESDSKLFKKVADHIIQLPSLDKFEPQHLSNTLWSFATAKEKHPKLFKKVAHHIVTLDSLDKFIPQNLSNTVWAFATAGESHPELFKTLAEEAIKRQHDFKPQELANFLWACATNGQIDDRLFSSLVPSVQQNLDQYTAQGLINLAWAYSVANVDAPSVFKEEFIYACLKKENGFIISEELTQLHQWQLWQEEMKSDVSLPLSLQKKCHEAFTSRVPRPSKFQDDVVSILSSMGLQPQEEVLLESGYRIDAVVEVNGQQIAVEVDGPSHFIGRSRERTGSTILKHRQVAALDGMLVVSVPHWEWNKLENDTEKKKQYLQQLLGI